MISSFRNEYFFLSNFYPCNIEYEDMQFLHVEGAFQAAKTLDRRERWRIAQLVTAAEAKKAGRQLDYRPDWEQIKVSIMKALVRQKFFTNRGLADWLIQTGKEVLIEGNTWGDTFWGVSGGHGLNHLGRILMEIREELNAIGRLFNGRRGG